MNVNRLLEDTVLMQINNNRYFVDKNLNSISISNNYVGLDHIFENSFLKDYKKNFIQLHHIGTSAILHNLILTQEEIDNCNSEGLEIFITEQGYFQCGSGDLLPIADFVNLRIEMDFDQYPLYWQTCDYKVKNLELDSCKKFVDNNHLNKVTVHLCNSDPNNLLHHYNFKIGYKNPFLQAIFNILKTTERKKTNADLIKYKFWCGNWRYEPHRHIIAAYLSNFNSKLGWHFDGDKSSIEHFYWFKFEDWQEKYPLHYHKLISGLEHLSRHHYYIDLKPKKYTLNNQVTDVGIRPVENGEHPSWQNQVAENLYSDTFCSIVNLGTFADCFPIFDEKPLNAIRNFRPFVLVGPPGSLQIMKDHGFKTFNKFWDESYDLEQDHQKRFIKIFDVIEYIDTLSIEQCKKIYKEMSGILKHNYNVISKGLDIP